MSSNYRHDLHVHTTASDGGYRPEDIVQMALAEGLETVAITDHDSTASLERALHEGDKSGLKVVPGVELTTSERYHLLGYFIDRDNAALRGYLDPLKVKSRAFMHSVLERLEKERGVSVSSEELDSRTGQGIPNMSHVLDILNRRGELDDLAFDGSAATKLFGSKDYLVGFFREFAATRPFKNIAEAIAIIREAGGVPVLAHPYMIDEGEVASLRDAGLGGLEVVTPKHDDDTRSHVAGLCEKYGLVPTGGTDFHGRFYESIEHGRGIGTCGVEVGVVEELEHRSEMCRA